MLKRHNLQKVIPIVTAIFVIQPNVYPAEQSDTEDTKKSYNATLSNEVSFSEETIEDYLPEEEDSDRIRAKRFNTDYSTNESNSVPVSFGVKGTTRDYETRNLDNKSLSFDTKIGKSVPERNKSVLTQNFSIKYRRKRFDELITNSFDQIGGKYAIYYLKKGNYKLTGNVGFDRVEYTESNVKDLDRIHEKIEMNKYLVNEDVKIDFGYKHEDLDQKIAERKKNKNEYDAGCRWRADKPWLYMVKVDGSTGYRDAIDSDTDDKDLDYKFNEAGVRIDHKITYDIKVYNSGEHYKKEYQGNGQYSNEGFELVQGWKFTALKTEANKLGIDVTINYKKFNYIDLNSLDFEKAGANLKCTFAHHDSYKIIGGLGYNHRNQRDNTKDRNDYTYIAGYERDIIVQLLDMSINGEYTNRDYKNQGDRSLYRLKLLIAYKI